VYAGWQFEQTSTLIASAVVWNVKVAPHELQRASTKLRFGCCVKRGSFPAALRRHN
jgi:hypothetical protein